MVYNKIKFSVKHNIFENKRWMNVFFFFFFFFCFVLGQDVGSDRISP